MLTTDPVAFINSTSSVWTFVNSSDTNVTLYYKLCRWDSWERTELIECVHNGTELHVEVEWDTAGKMKLAVFVFTDDYNSKDYLGCARTDITVAG